MAFVQHLKSREEFLSADEFRELKLCRAMSPVAACIYGSWYFAVEALLPQSANPPLGRIVVVAAFLLSWLSSFSSARMMRLNPIFYYACHWALTFHNFYLTFALNQGDRSWVIGAHVTVLAIALCIFTRRALVWYSLFTCVLLGGFWYSCRSSFDPVVVPGMLTILVAVNLGLSFRLKLLKDLSDSTKGFQVLFDSTFEGVAIHQRGNILDANQALKRILGFTKEELVGRNLNEFIDFVIGSGIEEKLGGEWADPFECTVVNKEGKKIQVELRSKIVYVGGKRLSLTAVQDLSFKKEAEKKKVAFEAAQEAIKIRDEFISIAAHELRTPLTSVKLQTGMTLRNIERLGAENLRAEQINNFVSLMDRQANRLTRLVEDMLDVSRLSLGKLKIQKEHFDLTALARDCLVTLKEQVDTSGSVISIEGLEPVWIYADKMRTEQMLVNLLTNALKYGQGKPIRLKTWTEEQNAFAEVQDQGDGIAPENIDRIFSRFERAISANEISGLGLGLYIARQIAEAHGGSLSVVSELHRGSAFCLKIPVSNFPKQPETIRT